MGGSFCSHCSAMLFEDVLGDLVCRRSECFAFVPFSYVERIAPTYESRRNGRPPRHAPDFHPSRVVRVRTPNNRNEWTTLVFIITLVVALCAIIFVGA